VSKDGLPPVISVVGKSGVGKTTVLEKVIREIKRRGHKVGTVKHDTHGFDVDKPGKDSWRHARAGSDAVVISGPRKMALIRQLEGEMSLDDIVKLMGDGALVEFASVVDAVNAAVAIQQANAERTGAFTVSYPRPEQVVASSLTASPRDADDSKPALAALSTIPSSVVDGVLVDGAYLWLECELDRVLDGYGQNSLIIGRIVAATAAADAVRGDDIDDAELLARTPLLAYLPPGRFAEIAETNSFPFPAEFRR